MVKGSDYSGPLPLFVRIQRLRNVLLNGRGPMSDYRYTQNPVFPPVFEDTPEVTISDLNFGNAGVPTEKQASVTRAAEAKRIMLNEGINPETVATAIGESNLLGQTSFAQDMDNLGVLDLEQIYGEEAAAFAASVQGSMENIDRRANASRPLGEILTDSALGITAGVNTGLGGIVAAGTGLFSDTGGQAVSQFVGETADALRGLQSDNLTEKRRLGSIRSALDAADIDQKYRENIAAGDSDLVAGLKRFGQEFTTGLGDFIDNPSLAGDAVSEGAGSLIASGGVGGVIRSAAAKVVGATLSSTATTTAGIALLEGGGAYQQVVNEIANMSEAELLEGSELYVSLRNQGYSHEASRAQVANKAGQQAGVVQGAIGAATGRFVAKFESNPFRATGGTIGQRAISGAGNILKEAAEETVQETSGGIFTNQAVKSFADPDRDIFEGAGKSAAEGLVAGAGLAAGLQAPGVAVQTGKATAKATTGTAKVVRKAAAARSAKVDEAIEESSEVGTEAVEAASQELMDAATQLRETASKEQDTSLQGITEAITISEQEINEGPKAVQNLFGEVEGSVELLRANAMTAIAETIEKNKGTKEDRDVGALWVATQMQRLKFANNVDTSQMSEEETALFDDIKSRMQTIESSPKLMRTIEKARDLTSNDLVSVPVPTADNISTPKMQSAVRDHTLLAQINPGEVDPEFIKGLLKQRKKAKITAEEIKTLEAAVKLAEKIRERDQRHEQLYQEANTAYKADPKGKKPEKPKGPTVAEVADGVRVKGKSRKNNQFSLSEHQAIIMSSMRAGDVKSAKAALDSLGNWAKSYQNRLEAARASYALNRTSNNTVNYDVWDGNQFLEGKGKVFISPSFPSNVQVGKQIAIDAALVASTYNDLLSTFEELKGKPLDATERPLYDEPTKEELASLEAELDAEAAPTKKERRIRKDAILKKKDSLIDDETKKAKQVTEVTDKAILAEMNDVGTLLDLLGIPVSAGVTVEPTQEQLLKAYSRLLEIYNDVASDESKAKERLKEIKELFSWLKSDVTDQNTDRRNRAVKAAKKRGPNESASLIAQLAEESIEVLEEGENSLDPKELEVKKRELKVIRFGADTVIKQDGPYKGLTNAEALEVAKQALTGSPAERGSENFRKALKVNTENGVSPFASMETPLKEVISVLQDFSNNKELLRKHTNEANAKKMADFVRKYGVQIAENMNNRLNDKSLMKYKGKQISPLEALKLEGVDFSSFAAGKALNIVDAETGKYDPTLLGSAVLAAVHWSLNDSEATQNIDEIDIAKILGKKIWELTEQEIASVSYTLRPSFAKEGLGRVIMDFWGVSPDDNVSLDYTTGIAHGVAGELLSAMEGNLIQTMRVESNTGPAAEGVVVGRTNEEVAKDINGVSTASDVIASAWLLDREPEVYIDRIPENNTKERQKGNWLGSLSDRVQRSLANHRKKPNYRNNDYLEGLKDLGKDDYVTLMGGKVLDEKLNNKSDVESAKGRYRQLERSYERLMQIDSKVLHTAQDSNKNIDDVAVYYDYFQSSNERTMAKGFNGQANKTMRQSYSPTKSVLDLSNEQTRDKLWLAIAQMSDAAPTEAIPRAESVRMAKELMNGEWSQALNIAMDHLENGASLKPLLELYKDEPLNDHALDALLVAAKYYIDTDFETDFEHDAAKKFTTFLAVEADGKTDGPFHAMVHFLSSRFNGTQLANMQRGGLFFNRHNATLNQFLDKTVGGASRPDLYSKGSVIAQSLFNKQESKLGKDAKELNDAVKLLLGRYADFTVEEKDGQTVLNITRNGMKNPLTITLYGSSEAGIAGKLQHEIQRGIYSDISKVIQKRAQGDKGAWLFDDLPAKERAVMDNALALFSTRKLIKTKKGSFVFTYEFDDFQYVIEEELTKNLSTEKLLNFRFSRNASEYMSTNLKTLVITPMVEAVHEVTDRAVETTKAPKLASNIQSTVIVELFKKEIERIKKEKGEAPSLNDVREAYKKVARYGALVESQSGTTEDAFHLNLSNKAKGDIGFEVGRSFDESYRGTTVIPGPSSAGVKFMPLFTISQGDASLMTRFFADNDLDLTFEQVFDGLNMSIDKIDEASEAINRANAEAILDNPFSAVNDSWKAWVRRVDIEDLSEDLRNDIIEMTQEEFPDQASSIVKVSDAFDLVSEKIEKDNRMIEGRKRVYKRTGFSLDHMATGENPYNHEGEFVEAETLDELAVKMNEMLDEELAAIDGKAKKEREAPVVAKPEQELVDAIEGIEATNGVQVMDGYIMEGVLNNLSKNKNEKALTSALMGSLSGWKVVVGDSASLNSYRKRHFGKDEVKIGYGLSDTVNKVMYIGNLSKETVLHEMLHAALATQIEDNFLEEAPTNRAFINLERLMEEFMELDFSKEDANVREAADAVKSEILLGLQKQNVEGDVIAMHEFIAWTLTNQNIERSLKNVKAQSKLVSLKNKAVRLIRRLLGLKTSTPIDIFGNIQWNTLAILNEGRMSPKALAKRTASSSAVLHQRLGNSRLRELMTKYNAKISAGIANMDLINVDGSLDWPAQIAANALAAGGVNLGSEELSAFKTLQTVLTSEIELNSPSLLRAAKVHKHVVKALKADDLLPYTTQAEAEALSDFISGSTAVLKKTSKSTDIVNFIALSQTHPALRQAMEKMDMPKSASLQGEDVDGILYNTANRAMLALSRRLAGDAKANNLKTSMDLVASRLALIEQEDTEQLDIQTNSLITKAETGIARIFETVSDSASNFRKGELIGEKGSWIEAVDRLFRASLDVAAATMVESKGKGLAREIVKAGNKIEWAPASEFIKTMNDIIGITDDNAAVFEMVNKAKSWVSSLRQHHRDELPAHIQKQFENKLTPQQWEALHKYYGQTDAASLKFVLSSNDISEIFQDRNKLKGEIEKLESVVTSNYNSNTTPILQRAKDLGEYLVTGKVPTDNSLMKNALTIHESRGQVNEQPLAEIDKETGDLTNSNLLSDEVLDLDALITLYAIDRMHVEKPDDFKLAQETLKDNPKGAEYTLNYITTLRGKELSNAGKNGRSLFNGWKGYLPAENRQGYKLVVAPESQRAKYERLGYEKLGDYKGHALDKQKMAYYFSRVGDNAQFNQGVMQTVQSKFNGVDRMSGRDLSGRTAGEIDLDPNQTLYDPIYTPSKNEGLIALRNKKGQIVGWERSVNAKMRKVVEENHRLDQMLGAWSGRHAEESLSQELNRELVKRLYKIWKDRDSSDTADFIDLSDPNLENEIWKDAYSMIPRETKDQISGIFGSEGFRVRKDMIDNAVGYRNMTVGAVFDGPTRLNDTFKEGIADFTTAIAGKNAYKYLVNGEKAWTAAVTTSKVLIVVKSLVIPMANLASNAVQLMTNGVPVRDIVKGTPKKLVEIEEHLKNEKRRIEITADIAQYARGSKQYNRLINERKRLRELSKKLSIWPLIEAGEFSTISEGITDADQAILQGRWADWMNAQIERLPQKAGTLGRYAFITQDTALYQGMSRSVQYGDFISKAILYDYMSKRRKMTHEKTMKIVQEEFVNYNLLPSAFRQKMEQMGFAWFWSFKLRSIKVAHKLMRDRPLRALFSSIGVPLIPEPLGITIGTPISDNGLSAVADGRAGYSLGLGMFWRSPSLNLWGNIFS